MKNEVKFGMDPANNIAFNMDGLMLLDVTNTIKTHMNKVQLATYARAVEKVSMGKKLNVRDLDVLDKVDDITMKYHGMCLKDSLVTKARIKSCKRYGRQFLDRDGSIQHMEMMVGSDMPERQWAFKEVIVDKFIEAVGIDCSKKFSEAVFKVHAGVQLTNEDLKTFAKFDNAADEILDWTIVDPKVMAAIQEACNRFGVTFAELRSSLLSVHAH